jgi:hypothetical protein
LSKESPLLSVSRFIVRPLALTRNIRKLGAPAARARVALLLPPSIRTVLAIEGRPFAPLVSLSIVVRAYKPPAKRMIVSFCGFALA